MAVDSNEVTRFKAALARLSSAEIKRRLDGSVIIRSWKRELAEAEDGRREQVVKDTEARLLDHAAEQRRRRKDRSRHVWALVGGAIIAVVSLIWSALPG